MKISDEVINDIRNSADIGTVIGHYIPLNKKGKNYTAVCPFHDDHDPSLSISEDKQIYKCFVCGNGGNVFTFVQNYKKISFPESVIEVAKIIGKPLDIEYSAPKKENKYQRFYNLLNDYIEYTSYLLTGSKLGVGAKEYLTNRGLEDSIIEEFQIGYNPEGDKVYQTLKAKGYSDEEMIKTYVARMSNNGMVDIFANRITFPIHDKYGNPIAFTARDYLGIYPNQKYINSSETNIYTKGDVIFNYHRAKDACKRSNCVIVTEGVMDVIAYKRAGIDNVVATLGTACTQRQIELLKELSKNIVLSYDGDKAGKAANMKLGNLLLEHDVNIEAIDNNTGLDPDEILNSPEGKNALRDLSSKNRISFIDYAIKNAKETYNLSNYSDRKKMAESLSILIDKLKDPRDRENYYNELYELTKIRKIDEDKSPKNKYNSERNVKNNTFLVDGLTKAEYVILVEMALSKDANDIYQKELGFLLDDTNNKLANMIMDEYRKSGICHLSRLLDETSDKNIKDLITNLATQESLPEEYDKNVLLGSINKVKEEIKKRKLNDLKEKIKMTSTVDKEKTNEYLKEYSQLLNEIGGK